MKVTQEKLPGSQIGLEIEISAETSQKAYEQVVGKFMRSAQIPGFRKGKVPRQVVLQRLGSERIKAAAVEELIEDSLKKAVSQVEVEAIGNFQLRSPFEELVSQFQPGETLTFSASVDVPPEVQLGQYTDLNIQVSEVKSDPLQVETVLREQQAERAALIPVEGRPAQSGDVVLLDFSGRFVPGSEGASQEIPGAQAEDFQLELVPGQFIEGFIDGVIGMNLDETKEVPVIFPEAYPQAELAGRSATFSVILKEIKEKELPPLNDEFAQEASEFATLTELRSFLEKKFQDEAKQKTEANTEKALLDQLLQVLEVEIPETLVENEVNYLLTQTATRLQTQGIDIKQLFTKDALPQIRERFRSEAIERLKRTLILAEVAKRESIKVEPQEIDERAKFLLEQYSDPEIDAQKLQEVVAEELLHEKVVQWLIEHSHIELVLAPTPAGQPTLDVTATEIIEEESTPLEVTATEITEEESTQAASTEIVETKPSEFKASTSE